MEQLVARRAHIRQLADISSKPDQSSAMLDPLKLKIYCGMEQLVARRAHNPKVISSSLVPATKELDVSLARRY
jgi:hypothetical protein